MPITICNFKHIRIRYQSVGRITGTVPALLLRGCLFLSGPGLRSQRLLRLYQRSQRQELSSWLQLRMRRLLCSMQPQIQRMSDRAGHPREKFQGGCNSIEQIILVLAKFGVGRGGSSRGCLEEDRSRPFMVLVGGRPEHCSARFQDFDGIHKRGGIVESQGVVAG